PRTSRPACNLCVHGRPAEHAPRTPAPRPAVPAHNSRRSVNLDGWTLRDEDGRFIDETSWGRNRHGGHH
ncbi:hypothetical protein ABZ841_39610, partial [Streptomyces flaveolus]